MNTGLYTSLRSYTAYATASLALNFGNPYTIGNKGQRNRLIGENILRKSAQLVEDLERINARNNTLKDALARKNTGLTPTEYAEKQLTNSIRSILNLREKLGIETPPGIGDNNALLHTITRKNKGTLLDLKS